MTRTCLGFWSLAALALLVGSARTAPAPKETARPSVVLPWGVVDAAGKTAYIVNAAGAIEAIELESGKALWDTKEATKPLAVLDKKLVAQAPEKGKANVVRIVVFDTTEKGKKVLESDPVAFPDWVSIGMTHGRSFSSSGRIDKGDLLLSWQARAFYAGGARPTPEIEERARKNAEGVARVNLETGKVEALDKDKVPAAPGPKLPKELEKVPGATVVGNQVVALSVEQAGAKQKLILKRWDVNTGKADDPVTLMEGMSLHHQLAADGGAVLVHQALVKEALPEGDYAWWVFSLETGKQLAKIPYEQGTTHATVLGERAYYVVQGPNKGGRPNPFEQLRTLKAIDLKTGKAVWEHEIEPVRMLPPLP
jgi:hypothetical protein